MCVDQASPIGLPHDHTAPVVATNPTNSGQSCLASGCHLAATDPGGQWTMAGTVYTDTADTTPAGGAIIRVLDAMGVVHTAAADSAGNFYINETIAYPAQTNVSNCTLSPTPLLMTTTIVATGQGGCNSCHATPIPAGGAVPLYISAM
jgi:hypothetical protein